MTAHFLDIWVNFDVIAYFFCRSRPICAGNFVPLHTN